MILDIHVVAQRLEQPADETGSLSRRQGGQSGFQRNGLLRQLGALPAPAGQRAAEYRRDGHAQVGRCDVGPVVHILLEPAGRVGSASPGPHQTHRINIQKQRGGATVRLRLGVENVGPAKGKGEGLQPARVLVQQVTQVRSRVMRGGDGEQHDDSVGSLTASGLRRVGEPVVAESALHSAHEGKEQQPVDCQPDHVAEAFYGDEAQQDEGDAGNDETGG